MRRIGRRRRCISGKSVGLHLRRDRGSVAGLSHYADLTQRQQIEIDYWRESPTERPESESIANFINKVSDATVLLDCLKNYTAIFERARSIVELGAGQGWASCLIKRLFPQASVTATDISRYAVASVPKWERIYGIKIDGFRSCTSYDLDQPDTSVDCIFCFAAAHHFVAHRRTLTEIDRVLAPGGHCFYFYEPSCIACIHKAAHWRVNKKRPDVPEDVLVYPRIRRIADEVGLRCDLTFYPSVVKRGRAETVYYSLLRGLPPLQRVLPCTVNYHFSKV